MSGYGQPSGTNWSPPASDFLLDAFERAKIYAPEGKHLQSARRSLNFLLTSKWSNRGLNLWKATELVIPLIPGVIKYFLTSDVVSVYDTYRRQYQMNGPQNFAVAFSTSIGSPQVTIAIPGNSSPVGSYIGIGIPVSVGGLILYGFYQVIATPTANSVTIAAGTNATSNVSGGGAVPSFTTTLGSQNITVTLNNHGYVAGGSFPVNVSTQVGGLTLSGNYVIQSITNANQFVILGPANALSGQTVSENSAQAQISLQNIAAGPTDILMSPFSRTDYASQANKTAPGPPTTYWVNKQIIPEVSLWPVTDNTGPYELHMWVQKQINYVNPANGQTLDMVQRFFYPCVCDLAEDLAWKFSSTDTYNTCKEKATQAWLDAEGTDVENVSTFIMPELPTGLN